MINTIIKCVAPGEATFVKKIVYLVGATVLGVLMGVIVYGIVELAQIKNVQSQSLIFGVRIFCVVGGAIGGFCAGRVWWRKIYVEKVWARRG